MASDATLRLLLACEEPATKRITVGELRAALTSKPSGRRCFYCKTIQYGAVCECCGAREK